MFYYFEHVLKGTFLVSGKTLPQVAIRWVLQRPPVTSVIIGSKKMHQLEDNVGACGWKLSQEEVG